MSLLSAACTAGELCLPEAWTDAPIQQVELVPLQFHRDQRGWLAELFRRDELPPCCWPAMGYVSQTEPGVARGPHQHTHQTDVFVFLGPGEFQVVLWDVRPGSASRGHRMRLHLGASQPARLVVPPGVVHGYRNVGREPGWVLNFPNQLYRGWNRQQPVDELRWEQLRPEAFPWD